jgi:plasmid stability protein
MKTTLDLPDDLVRRLKLRAVRDGRKLQDLAADVLRDGLDSREHSRSRKRPIILRDKKTGVPVIQCPRKAPRGRELTPEKVAEILNAQEAEWARDLG